MTFTGTVYRDLLFFQSAFPVQLIRRNETNHDESIKLKKKFFNQ